MGDLISASQSAFIPDRLITDNILVAAEVGHYLNRKQCGAVGWSALKLDMAKAYDRMEWPFLRGMLLALGFDDRWVELLMLCVTTVSYSFMINGAHSTSITPTRGLRQGDPLSPYLFIICAEGLSLLLQQVQNRGLIHGCRVARGAPPISHLFFTDDSLLFFRANRHEASEIKNCLQLYESLSGQKVNYHKSSICYSRNTGQNDKDMVAQILGVTQAPNFGKYLGLPSFVGRNKKAAFAYIEDKIKQRVGSWNKKLLTQAGKEILLKSVAQAMPTFSMSVFLLPISVCTAIERTMNRYWWGSGTDRGIHWKAWDKLCIPKKYGGLGFKDLRAFNLAMLRKQAWRLLTNTDSLVAKVYKARYYPKDTFLEATIGNNPSFCWRSIMAAKDLVCGGIRRRVGNGSSTLIWEHPWLNDELDPMIHTEIPQYLSGAKVIGLIDRDTGTWDPHILADIFQPSDIPRIQSIPIAPEYDDIWYWYGDPNGCYSVKSGYRHIVGSYEHNSNDFDGIVYAAAILYHLWRARNGAVWDACLPTPTKLLSVAAATMKAWKDIHHRHLPSQPRTASHHVAAKQHPLPPLGPNAEPAGNGLPPLQAAASESVIGEMMTPVKCYVDASYHRGTNVAAVGAVLLDANGHYISAFSAPLAGCHSPLMAEALACKEALSWLKRRNELSIRIHTDCQQLQCYLSGPPPTLRSHLGYAIDSCRTYMSAFNYCSVLYIPRLQNLLAHTLATSTLSFNTAMYWNNVPPDSILTLL
ncbi:PREDICTED: uncharacterized protein LOC109167861 [Ipomoea nil]|uniref:uncharacterized protein LOC109167861 n=1 Tax=Ipomoea nil TaxID=35883 RepID=UPI0009018F12|nr:PREDICTED: uncharacterized protein LOC109167861 [Ipomoea nil]